MPNSICYLTSWRIVGSKELIICLRYFNDFEKEIISLFKCSLLHNASIRKPPGSFLFYFIGFEAWASKMH